MCEPKLKQTMQDVDDGEILERKEDSLKQMFLELMSCTFQTVFGYICLDISVSISLHYIAKIGVIENAGYGFAYTCMNILIIPFGFGFNQSLNMHAAQALGNDKQSLAKRFVTLNAYILLLTLIPLCFILYSLKYPFQFIITENRQQTSDIAWTFLNYFLPAAILALEFEGLKTYMIANKITYPFTVIHIVTTLLHWLFTWLFIEIFDLGIQGAGVTIIITEILNLVGLLLFVIFTNLKSTIFAGVRILPDWNQFLTLAPSYIKTSAPIVLHLYSEFFVFFLLSFVAMSLGTDQMNANLGVQNSVGLLFRFPISLSLALVSYVGTEMGCGNIKKAQLYIFAGIVILVISDIIIVGLLYSFKNAWAEFYSANDQVKQLLFDLFPWMVYGIVIADGCQGTVNGALKGINKINLVFYSTLIAYYVICIPLVFVFTYSWGLDNGVVGIWQAFGLANLVLLILYSYSLLSTDWQLESKLIIRRVAIQNTLHKTSIIQIQDE